MRKRECFFPDSFSKVTVESCLHFYTNLSNHIDRISLIDKSGSRAHQGGQVAESAHLSEPGRPRVGKEWFIKEAAVMCTEQQQKSTHYIVWAGAIFPTCTGNLHLWIACSSHLLIYLIRSFISFLLICKSSFLRKLALYHIARSIFHFVICLLILPKNFVENFHLEI